MLKSYKNQKATASANNIICFTRWNTTKKKNLNKKKNKKTTGYGFTKGCIWDDLT